MDVQPDFFDMPVHCELIIKEEELFTCSKCDKKFCDHSLLEAHQQSNCDQNQFCCSYCEEKFKTARKLKTHETIHSGLSPLKCHECDKRFTNSNSRKRHEMTHTGETLTPADLDLLSVARKAANK